MQQTMELGGGGKGGNKRARKKVEKSRVVPGAGGLNNPVGASLLSSGDLFSVPDGLLRKGEEVLATLSPNQRGRSRAVYDLSTFVFLLLCISVRRSASTGTVPRNP